ncbi:MAG: hypothetical protein KDI82_04640 [Gammaproteobacteria bacterium]|nr:hypothetical protein [Gammaproteobacteria bacterium]
MITMKKRAPGLSKCILPALLAALATPVHALQVTGDVIDLGGTFEYRFSVVNDDPISDLLIVTIDDAPPGEMLIADTLMAPAGFLTNYDSGLGLIDFIADSALSFPSGVTGLFTFQSASPLTQNFTSYTALDLFVNEYPGTVDAQLVQAVSLPSVIALLGLGLGIFAVRAARAGKPASPDQLLNA